MAHSAGEQALPALHNASCTSDRYEGHLCASCVSGFQHVKAEGEYEYECVECETADLAASVLALVVAVAIAGAICTLLWRKYKPTKEAETLALQAVLRSVRVVTDPVHTHLRSGELPAWGCA